MTDKKDKNPFSNLWLDIVEGLKEKPAYLLIFAIVAIFFLGGTASLVAGTVVQNSVSTIVGALVAVCGLAAACYVIKIVEEPSIKTYYKTSSIRKKWSTGLVIEPSKIEEQASEMLQKLLLEGNLSLGLSYKDPTSKILMTHTVVGDYAERDRMSDIMASYIVATKANKGIEFNKVVIPKSGNILFSTKVAEKLGVEIIAFRGEKYCIAKDEHLEPKQNYFDGNVNESDKVIIVDDVTFRGNTVMNTLEWLKNVGIKAEAVFVLAAHQQYVDNINSVLNKSYPGTSFYPIITI